MVEAMDCERGGHPSAEEAWFRALSEEQRGEFVREYGEKQARLGLLRTRERAAWIREMGQAAALFWLFDALLLSHATVWTSLAAALVGCALGAVLVAVNAERLLAASLGTAVFAAFCFLSRGGIAPQHLFMLCPMAAACAWLGLRRETRAYG